MVNGKCPSIYHLPESLRHLFRSEELNTLIFRLGHCESYSFTLERETAIANSQQLSSQVLAPTIVPNPDFVFHCCWDNFDVIKETYSGSGTTHSAHGLQLQELPTDIGVQPSSYQLDPIPRNKTRSTEPLLEADIPPYYRGQRKPPYYDFKELPQEKVKELSDGQKIHVLWLVCRYLERGDQKVPNWAGFISITGEMPDNKTTIDYMPVVNHPVTELSTVQELLRLSKIATDVIGQRYTTCTFDLAIVMKALEILWNEKEKYRDFIIQIGAFHTICAYFNVLGKKMEGRSGFAEVVLESGICSSGSINGVMKGKHYNRALCVHLAVCEAYL